MSQREFGNAFLFTNSLFRETGYPNPVKDWIVGCCRRKAAHHSRSMRFTLFSASYELPGLVKHDFTQVTNEIIKVIGKSRSFRGAEANFQLILPYLNGRSPEQNKIMLELAVENDQIHHASLCATEYLPPILETHGNLLDEQTRVRLEGICKEYLQHKREWEKRHG